MRRYRKAVRHSKRVVVTLLVVAFVLVVLPNLLLKIPSVERAVARRVQTELSQALDTRVSIGRIGIDWLQQIELNDVVIYDRADMRMVAAKRLTGGVELMPLFKGCVSISSARLFSGELHVYRSRPDTALNIQFALDALKKKDPEDKSESLRLNINTILLRNCRLSAVGLLPAQSQPIELQGLNTTVRLFEVDRTGLQAQLRHMAFVEKHTGLVVRELRGDVRLQGDTLSVEQLRLQLPHSRLDLTSARCVFSPAGTSLPTLILTALEGKMRPSDLSGLLPILATLEEDLELSAPEVLVAAREAFMPEMSIRYGEELSLDFGLGLADIDQREDMQVRFRLDALKLGEGIYALAGDLFPGKRPDELSYLGAVDVMAAVTGRLSDLRVKTRIETDAGAITVQGEMGLDSAWRFSHVDGQATTNGLDLKPIAVSKDWPEHAAFDLRLSARREGGTLFSGNVDGRVSQLTYRGYTYEDLTIQGEALRGRWFGDVTMNDPNGSILLHSEGEGLPFASASSVIGWQLTARDVRPDRLLPGYGLPEAETSLVSSGQLVGSRLDNLSGTISVDSLRWQTADKALLLHDLTVEAAQQEQGRTISIQSPYLRGKLQGDFRPSALPATFVRFASDYFPALLQRRHADFHADEDTNLRLRLDASLPQEICSFFALPLAEAEAVRIEADYAGSSHHLDFLLRTDKLIALNKELRDVELRLNTSAREAVLSCRTDLYQDDGAMISGLNLSATAAGDTIRTRLDMGQDREGQHNGFVSLLTGFSRDADAQLSTIFRLDSSTARIGGVEWQIASAEAMVAPKRVVVHNLSIKSPGKGVEAEGVLSASPQDSLHVDVDHIGLRYILNLAGVDFDLIDVEMTGKAVLSDISNRQFMQARITGERFLVNGVNVGPVSAFGSWDKDNLRIMLDARVHNPDGTYTTGKGYIRPFNPHAGLDLSFDAHHANVAFIGPFLSEFCNKLEGRASGQMRLFGDFSDLTIEGEAVTEQVTFGVSALNTEYIFDGQKATFSPTEMRFENMLASDPEGNTARLNARVTHRAFEEVKVDMRVSDAKKILAYNLTERDNPNIYGRAYVSGAAYLRDVPGGMRCDVSLTSERQTSIVLNFSQPTTAEEYRFLHFVDGNKREADATEHLGEMPLRPMVIVDDERETDFHLVMNMNVTPDAAVGLILDSQTGDGLRGNAQGDLRLDYHTLGDVINVYGGLELLSGTYDFNLRQIVQKRFNLKEGSRVDFAGDPMNAMLNITAEYNLTANLNDLDESLVSDIRRTTIPVNCQLQINGAMLHPTIGFDIKLPNSDSELERRVQSLIHSDDSMTKQMVYLLVLGKFYTPEHIYNTGSGTDNWTAVAATTLSQQLSNILGTLSDKVQIGTSIKTTNTSFQDTDIELLLSSRLLNNRLLINGNVGYRDNPNLQNTYVGEFDAEYKINSSGSIRLKAYNHYNNLYQYLRQSLTTQGLGVNKKQDFERHLPKRKEREDKRVPIDTLSSPLLFNEPRPIPAER